METLIKDIKKDPFNSVNELSPSKIEELIKHSADKYYNSGNPVLSDALYDLLIDFLKVKKPKSKVLKDVGSNVNAKNKVTLDYPLYSMDKIKPPSKELDKWLNKFPAPYYLSDKLDGISALLVYKEDKTIGLYTRGTAIEGLDISFLLKYLSGVPTPDTVADYVKDKKLKPKSNVMAFRGELLMKKSVFQSKYCKEKKNERSIVAGVVNSINVDPLIAKDLSLVIYEVVDPFNKIKKQYKMIKALGLKMVHAKKFEKLDFEILSDYYKIRRAESKYLMDGIIVTNNEKHKRTTKSNPKYSFAFKDVLDEQVANFNVLGVEWNVSKDGYINPVLLLETQTLGGVDISRVTAFNAKYIQDNKIGPGTVIKLVRSGDVIPHILEIVKASKTPQMPDMEYTWTKSNVDIIVKDKKTNKDVTIKEMVYFFKKMDIKNLGEGNVKKMVDIGLDSIEKVIKANKDDLLKVDGFKEKTVDKVYLGIHSVLQKTDLALLMGASNLFGHGFGSTRCQLILDVYPEILDSLKSMTKCQLLDKIKEIDGFDTITAQQFVDHLEEFNQFFDKIKSFVKFKQATKTKNQKMKDQVLVFTGFRDKDLEQKIVEAGGQIKTTVSSNTTILICKDETVKNGDSGKIKDAKKKNIKIMTKDEVLKMLQ